VRGGVVVVDPAVADDFLHDGVHQRDVGARQRCQVHDNGAYSALVVLLMLSSS
jgi:hypothetical protein